MAPKDAEDDDAAAEEESTGIVTPDGFRDSIDGAGTIDDDVGSLTATELAFSAMHRKWAPLSSALSTSRTVLFVVLFDSKMVSLMV